MNVTDIVLILVGISTVVGSLVSVVWVISHKVSYTYVNETFMRKDLHSQEYKSLLEKIKELKNAINKLDEDINNGKQA